MDERLQSALRWAANRHTRVSSFAICRFTPAGRYVHAEFASLDEARAAARRYRQGTRGRKLIICALTPEGWVFELEEVKFDRT